MPAYTVICHKLGNMFKNHSTFNDMIFSGFEVEIKLHISAKCALKV